MQLKKRHTVDVLQTRLFPKWCNYSNEFASRINGGSVGTSEAYYCEKGVLQVWLKLHDASHTRFCRYTEGLYHCTAKLLSRPITHACVLLVAGDEHHRRRQDTLADRGQANFHLHKPTYNARKINGQQQQLFTHCVHKTMHLNTAFHGEL